MVINGEKLLTLAPIKAMARAKQHNFGVSSGLGEAGYDIRIKQAVTFQRDLYGKRSVVRLGLDAEGESVALTQPGRFVIASSLEEFAMPQELLGIVHDKSTWARRGLSVFNTVIEPGWRGFLTLELVYHGNEVLHIEAGSGIAQVLFHQVSCASMYNGRYQNQGDYPVSAILMPPAANAA